MASPTAAWSDSIFAAVAIVAMQEYPEGDTAVNCRSSGGVVLSAQQFSGLRQASGAGSATEPEGLSEERR